MADNRKMVRCIICGAVFPEGAQTCPVCGVGPENFVPVEMSQIAYRNNTENIYLVLGGGAAAVSAAEAIRARDNTGSVVMLCEENVSPYNRPMLTKAFPIAQASSIQMHEAAWYQENQVQLYTGMKIVAINPEDKEVLLANGMTFHYDRLIYALGAHSFVPPVPGCDTPGCETIRTVSDVQKIARTLPEIAKAVVIGGGVLGLEAAWLLKKAGADVTVVEAAERLMPRQLDGQASSWLKDSVEAHGVRVLTGAKTEKIDGDGHVTAVRLSDGTSLPCEMVLFSTGVRPNCEIAKDAGIAVNRAVVVDENMQTSVKDIFACGDCAEFAGVNLCLWSEAEDQGRIAGANASGDFLKYVPKPCPVSMHAFDVGLYAAGSMDGQREQTASGENLEILYRNGQTLTGCILLGDTSRAAALTEKIATA